MQKNALGRVLHILETNIVSITASICVEYSQGPRTHNLLRKFVAFSFEENHDLT